MGRENFGVREGEKENKDSKGSLNKFTRREFLKFILALSSGAFLWFIFPNLLKRSVPEKKDNPEETFFRILNLILSNYENNNERFFDENEIDKYLESVKNGENKIVNFCFTKKYRTPEEVLGELWKIKLEKNKNLKGEKNLSTIAQEICYEYQQQPKGYIKSLEHFSSYLNNVIIESLTIIDFDSLLERMGFSEERKNIILSFFYSDPTKETSFINFLRQVLLSLILVEVCFVDEKNYHLNLKTLELILRNYGLSFLNSIPSLHDNIISFGPFQISKHVLPQKNSELTGTYPPRVITRFINKNLLSRLPSDLKERYKFPEFIDDLRDRNHYRVQVFSMIYYLLNLFSCFSTKRLKSLLPTGKDEEEKDQRIKNRKVKFLNELAFYLAGAHHSPARINSLFINYLKNNFNPEGGKTFYEYIEQIGKKSHYPRKLFIYLKKFSVNYQA